VNHRPISKQFVKILIEGAQSEDPKVSKDWKEEISFMFYELYEADDEQEKNSIGKCIPQYILHIKRVMHMMVVGGFLTSMLDQFE
jgi:hypothetical protein